ncbi:MAG: Gfo/Idh/MocA family oxidoreductase, partial [Lachnospiraceae bacterium]|nr:Gfo/Idh/MocA family oxidoreductase [Lachnospiraceae bacterium]
MSYKVRIALIGIGAMGRKYAEMIASGMVDNMLLAAVVVRRPELYEWAEALVNITGEKVKIYPNTDALYAEPDVFDAVLIATPHKSHAELAFRAFETGKHVMCDKPASVTVGEAGKMADMADLHHLIYGVMLHQHKYPKYIKIKMISEDGE